MQPVLGLVPHRAVRPVDHLVGDLVAAVGGKAVQDNRIRLSPSEERRVDLERPERPHPVQSVVLLAHRRPGVGDEDVGAVGGRLRIGRHGHRGAGVCGTFLGGRDELRVGLETGGGGDGDMYARGDPAEHQRVRHVVGAVAEVGQPQAVQRAPAFVERLQIGEHLARVELVGQRVDHRHRRGGRHRGQPLLGEGPPHDGVDVARQHPSGVLQRLLAPQLGVAAVDHDGVPAELGDADLEREPGAGGVLVEDDGHAARAFERAAAERGLLQLGGQRQHLGLLVGRQVVVAQEVPGHRATTGLVEHGRQSAARKSSICASVMISGGASRITFGAAALTRKPASRAAASTGLAASAREHDAAQQPATADVVDQWMTQ